MKVYRVVFDGWMALQLFYTLYNVTKFKSFQSFHYLCLNFFQCCLPRKAVTCVWIARYLKIIGLITKIFKSKQQKHFNVQISIVTNSTHSSIKTNNISSYVILEQDHFDTAAWFQAHHVYKS